MEKLKKIANALDVIVRVLFWLCIAGTILAAVAVILVPLSLSGAQGVISGADGPSVTFFGLTGLDLGYVSLTLNGGLAGRVPEWPYIALLAVLAAAAVALTLTVLAALRAVLRPMKEGRPFDQAVSRNLRRLSVIALICGGAFSAADYACTQLIFHMVDVTALFDPAQVASATVNYRLDLSFLAVFAVLLLLSYIFRYGAELQTLSDETL